MTPNVHAARALAVAQTCRLAVDQGRLPIDLAEAVMAADLLALSIQAHRDGDLDTAAVLHFDAQNAALRRQVELDMARAEPVPDMPPWPLGATESDETEESEGETPPDQNEERDEEEEPER